MTKHRTIHLVKFHPTVSRPCAYLNCPLWVPPPYNCKHRPLELTALRAEKAKLGRHRRDIGGSPSPDKKDDREAPAEGLKRLMCALRPGSIVPSKNAPAVGNFSCPPPPSRKYLGWVKRIVNVNRLNLVLVWISWMCLGISRALKHVLDLMDWLES
ncbi:hypothetical protein NPIL_583411 [Nephila pilipes]|uniref:Uncharacterized protein n=1 Tax=Nephila pilipes TaxID=299642 RepID=A0A8X6Q9P4_NEPPI|nr:hypothetical protein NPIL_583411 [Nephila pilipes]